MRRCENTRTRQPSAKYECRYANNGEVQNDYERRFKEELDSTRNQMEGSIPVKHKESYELLNLRRMEEQMAKQKNYPEAHRVQTKIAALYKQENAAWLQTRSQRIQAALKQLKAKHSNELALFRKNISNGLDAQRRDRWVEEQRLNQKYDNLSRDLKAVQERECLAFKGELTTKVKIVAPEN